MTDTRQVKTLPNGFRLVLDEGSNSEVSQMVKIAAKKRKNQIRNKRRRKRKQTEAKAKVK